MTYVNYLKASKKRKKLTSAAKAGEDEPEHETRGAEPAADKGPQKYGHLGVFVLFSCFSNHLTLKWQ